MKMVSAFDFLLSLLLLRIGFAMAQDYTEPYRPQYHFTPPKNWMNDPNGLLYHEGVYHLFFQHNPNGITWGNMSWGHATSSDLVHWENQALALEARTNVTGGLTEMFFSGSAVADVNNTSGFGIDGNTPLVAVYTSLYPQAQDLPSGKSVKAGQQSQSIAYSLDQGYTWTTYDAGNPVILEPPSPYQSSDNLNNFRDPFVFWHNLSQKWIMVVSLANEHKILVYTSTSLREWAYTSEFGPVNAVGGQWECPSLFSLPIDRNTTATKWVLQIGLNPGGPSIGSGTQYIIGTFDGQSFVPDPESVYDPPSTPPGSTILEDFEAATWSALGWNATGDFANTGPVEGAFSNQQKVSGYYGDRLVNTFFDGDNSTGKIISPIFNITKGYINFLVGGGYNPHDKLTYGTAADTATSINLLVNGEVVRSATGRNGEALVWDGWNVESYIGSPAQIEIVDFSTEGFGHINVDQIVFSESLALEQKANWVDWGPDYYAAVVYNGLPDGEHMSIGWMNNWAYGGDIPTYPWRSTMSIPRSYELGTIGGKPTLLQAPTQNLSTLRDDSRTYQKSWTSFPTGVETLDIQGNMLDISLTFNAAPESKWPSFATVSSAILGKVGAKPNLGSDQASYYRTATALTGARNASFGLHLGADLTGDEKTVVGYDLASQTLYLDRTLSGNTTFNKIFPGVYRAPLEPDASGKVDVRVLLDWSSVEVFGGRGEAVLTAQIFPDTKGRQVAIFASGITDGNFHVTVDKLESSWA